MKKWQLKYGVNYGFGSSDRVSVASIHISTCELSDFVSSFIMGNNFEVVTYIYLVHVCRRKKSNVCVLVKIDSGGLTCTPLYWRNTSNEKLSTAITFTVYLLPTSAMRWYVRPEVSCSSSEYMSAWLTPSRHVNHKLQTYLIWWPAVCATTVCSS